MKIFCLVLTGQPLTDDMCDLLHTTAREMIRAGRARCRFYSEHYEGLVVATGKTVSLGSVSGAVFEATVESDQFITRVKYIVRTADLEHLDDARWTTLSAVEKWPEPSVN